MAGRRLGIRRHEIVAAPIDLESDTPSVGRWRSASRTRRTNLPRGLVTDSRFPQFEAVDPPARATHQGRNIPGACETWASMAGMEPLRVRLNGMASWI